MTATGYGVGIDVGTSFTAAATYREGRAEAVTLGDHGDVIPSVVFLREDGVLLVGDAAERRAVADASRVAREFKRRIGDDVPLWLGGQPHTAEALTAVVVRWVVELVTAREGGPPDRIVLTLPAGWRDHRRGLLHAAAARAGVDDAELLAEPVAAAVHHAARHDLPPGATVGVYDLGGGTFDATIVRRAGEGFAPVGQPQGDDNLGGIDFDTVVWDHIVEVVGAHRLALDDPSPRQLRALAQVRAAAVDAKEALSHDTQAVIPITLAGLMAEVRITRAEFEEMARPALLRTIEVFARTCALAGIAPADLDAVLLVGGSSRIPLITQLVGHELGARVVVDAHPKLATCLGAARTATPGDHPSRSSRPTDLVEPTPTPTPAPVTAETPTSDHPPVAVPTAPVAVAVAPGPIPEAGPERSRRLQVVVVAAAVALVAGGTAAVLRLLAGDDEPTDPVTGEAASATTTTDLESTTTRPPQTTSTTAATPASAASGTVGSTEPSTTTTASTTTTTTTTTPGAPCDPAGGHPDCTNNSSDGTYRIVAGYADCLQDLGDPGICTDLDGDNVAGYPDSG